jgi:hypothetical protein
MAARQLGFGEVRRRAATALIGLTLPLAVGCVPPGVELRHVLSRAPDGHRLLRERANELELFDLDTEQATWRVRVARSEGFSGAIVAWSQNGAFFVLGEQEYPASQLGRYAVWERDTGRRVSPVYVIKGQFVTAEGGLAVSNDGRWFACNRAKGAVRLYDTRSEHVALEVAIHDLSYLPLAFAPDSANFTLARQLFELHDGRWQETLSFPDAVSNTWVEERLAVVTNAGVEIWEAGKLTQRVAARGPVELVGSEQWLAIIEAIDLEQARLDAHLERLTLYDLERAQPRFVRSDLGSELQVVFRGPRLFVRAFRDTFDTYVLELDVHSGKTLQQAGFGAWAAGYRSSPSERYFFPIVLPEARYIELRDSYDQHRGSFSRLELR